MARIVERLTGRGGQYPMDSGNSALSRFAYLMVVQRGDLDRFRFLSATFRDRPVEVMWDRRVGERRRSTNGPSVDRRAGDRRNTPPASWNNLGFLVARRELDKQGR
jgi:hypothetical protein